MKRIQYPNSLFVLFVAKPVITEKTSESICKEFILRGNLSMNVNIVAKPLMGLTVYLPILAQITNKSLKSFWF